MKVQSIYNSKIFKKGLEFAADKTLLFGATTSFALSMIARPISIMVAPKTDVENKKYACAKSFASGVVNLGLATALSIPVAYAKEKIDKNPTNYLKASTIEKLKAGEKCLQKSSKYRFASQLFKLGLGFLVVVPKSVFTCNLIPPIMDKISPKKEVTFTGSIECLAKGMGKIMDFPFVEKMADKFHDTKFEQHLISLTDIAATMTFIHQTNKNKKIEESRKKTLIYNSAISTGLCVGVGYGLSKILDKPVEKFTQKFAEINKNSPKLNKYLDGIKIVKPAMIFGGIYYVAIPLISTFLADRVEPKKVNRYKK